MSLPRALSLSGGGGVFGGGGSRERVAFARVKFLGGDFIDLGAVTKYSKGFVFRVLLLVCKIGQKFMRFGRRKEKRLSCVTRATNGCTHRNARFFFRATLSLSLLLSNTRPD